MYFVKLLPSLSFLLLLISCGSADKDNKAVIDTTIHSPVNTTAVDTSGKNLQTVAINPVSPVVSSPVPGGGALNPAHGQPGHRCDIAVGAPLDSKPATTATSSTPIQLNSNSNPATPAASPITVTKSSVPATTNTATGMNPAHGQPGHRCDIAVGAPLNSPPGNTTTPASQPVSFQPSIPGATPVVTPAKPAATPVATQTVTAPGMNPAHGQPGHRCDIAVGAPLNSKPAAEAEKPKTN